MLLLGRYTKTSFKVEVPATALKLVQVSMSLEKKVKAKVDQKHSARNKKDKSTKKRGNRGNLEDPMRRGREKERKRK